ncbi:prephenate dehydratase [Pseudoleptotrichia goodfellowii F0264]|uniref:prephenate dehydratase n=2 Tax=Pseudoleptotrichia goodfellowii TaxID=157692 RepID=D0GM95_9FUSO|nr:prephenate dehydratase [Pseudoleptotrichia goodfellowii F0264]
MKHYVEIILRDIMDSSKEYQKFKIGVSEEYINDLEFDGKKLGYTGVPGAYAYEVMINLMKNNEISNGKTTDENILNFNSHKELIEAVEAGKADFGILPIENSIAGEVTDSIDLINKRNIHIVGEVRHKIEHNLLGIKGSKIEDIKRIYSHEQALMQCSDFLEKHSYWKKEKVANTALAAKYIKDTESKENGCIANMRAKEMYDLELLEKNINNEKENYTRFFIISNKNLISENSKKVSIITGTKNESGALMELLKIFSVYGLNMVSLKSRPKPNKPWEYYFYIDFEGNLKEEKVKKALEEIRIKSIYLQVLGNYKIYNSEI